jgi:hypothetical protein
LAARCATVPLEPDVGIVSSSIVFPAAEWGERSFDEVFPPRSYRDRDGEGTEQPNPWELLRERDVPMKNIGSTRTCEIVNRSVRVPSQSAEERAREGLATARRSRGGGDPDERGASI